MTADTPAAAPITAEQAWVLAQNFHAIYERLAPHFGYRTRPETRGWVADSPNGKLMQAVCKAMVDEGWIAPGAALSAPVAAPPAASGVDALWAGKLLGYLESQMFPPSASHVPPDFRDGYNHALRAVIERVEFERTHLSTALTGSGHG